MTRTTGTDAIVLRDFALHPDAVRVGRRGREPAAAVDLAAPAAAPPAPRHDELLAAALAEAREEGLRQGREEGLRAGLEEGRRKGEAEAQVAARAALDKAVAAATAPLKERERALAALAASLSGQQAAWRDQGEEEAVALAYELLCRLLGDALLTADGVRAQARQLQAALGSRELAVRVHPADAERLRAVEPALEGLRWVADPAVGVGGCIADGGAGSLDARLETVLEQCRQGLLEARARRLAQAGGGAA